MDIKQKVIWVTGGCSGMGLASTKMFLAQGAMVLVTDINEEKGQILSSELGENFLFAKADLTSTEEMQTAIKAAIEKWGRLDALLACAGAGHASWTIPMAPTKESIASGGQFDWHYTGVGPGSLESFKCDIDINLNGNFDAGRLAAWEIFKNEPDENGERGVIIFISSISANKRHSPGNNAGYAASKAGLIGLTKEMAVNLAPAGIRVNTILPGFFDTPLVQGLKPIMGAWQEAQIFPKKSGDPANIGSMALEIINNPFVNNAVIEVTAGFAGTPSFQCK
ncbi:MAG: SDR family NAD(P)-dependent oxidoreductase [Dehalobacterium sp.]